ncbi:MAG TPA: hypothetical protein DDY32_02945 [Desulfobulbaceae bacterium]|nr:hypothetical protein [Desulfobulbaceae bacterium]
MDNTLLYTLLISVAPALLMVGPSLLILKYFKWKTRDRKSPLNIDLLRGPGHSLEEKVSELTIDIIGGVFMIPIASLALYSSVISDDYFFGRKPGTIVIMIFLIAGVGIVLYLLQNIYKQIKLRNVLRLGCECEQAVGQDLNELLRYGFNVYHDFPAGDFNIDHIAIGPTGVFAIETKGRAKQLKAEKENWKVSFDGETLHFPTWSEREPIAQAKRQAKWLSKWLESATGSPQQVFPVLAIPGWFIERTKPSDLRIYPGKNSTFLAKGQATLSKERIQALSHQVEAKCRDIKTSSYKKE